MQEYATKEGDTGSPEVQVAMLTRRIAELTEHLQAAQARPPQPSWPAAAGRPAPPAAGLPAEDGHRPLPGAHRAARPAAITRSGGVACTSRRSPDAPVRTAAGHRATRASHEYAEPVQRTGRSSVVASGAAPASCPARRPRASIEDRPRRSSSRGVCTRSQGRHDSHMTEQQLSAPQHSTAVIDNGAFGTREITFSTGRLARQAAGSVARPAGRDRRASPPPPPASTRRSSSTSSR